MTNVVIILLAGATAFNVGILIGQGGSIWRKGFYESRFTANASKQYNEIILEDVNITEYCIEELRQATSGDGTDIDTLVSMLQNRTSDPGRRNITDGSRYYVELHLELNFFQAMEYCARQGLRLATFDNEDDFNQLSRFLQEKTPGIDFMIGYDNFYIGAHDLGQKGKFTWWPTGRELTYTNWMVGEPNNKQQTLRGVKYEEERCVELYRAPEFQPFDFILRSGEFKMYDVSCYKRRKFVCEDPLALY